MSQWSQRAKVLLKKNHIDENCTERIGKFKVGDRFAACKICLPVILQENCLKDIAEVRDPRKNFYTLCSKHEGYAVHTYTIVSVNGSAN